MLMTNAALRTYMPSDIHNNVSIIITRQILLYFDPILMLENGYVCVCDYITYVFAIYCVKLSTKLHIPNCRENNE